MAVPGSVGPERLVAVVVVGLLVAGAVTPAAGTVAGQSQPQTDDTVTRIAVAENGSARWTIQIRTRLDSERRVEEYAAFQRRFENDTARYLDPFRTRMRGVVANAANATGREMTAVNFTASTRIQEVPRRWGVVTYEFTWTNFAAEADGTLAVGDAFQGGFFIAADDTLQVEAPAGYDVAGVEPEPDGRDGAVVTWRGRENFGDAEPRVAFEPAPAGNQSTDGATPTTGSPPTDAGGSASGGVVLVAVATGAFVVLGVAGVVLYRRRDRTATAPDAPGRETTEQSRAPAEESGSATVKTDEERVLDLLEENGGRVRQAAIAEAFDWSDSKTSRLVGRMAEDGTVEKLKLGRENLVALDDGDE